MGSRAVGLNYDEGCGPGTGAGVGRSYGVGHGTGHGYSDGYGAGWPVDVGSDFIPVSCQAGSVEYLLSPGEDLARENRVDSFWPLYEVALHRVEHG